MLEAKEAQIIYNFLKNSLQKGLHKIYKKLIL